MIILIIKRGGEIIKNLFEEEKPISVEDYELNEFPLLSRYSVYDIINYTQPVLLKDIDQMGMAVSLEARIPFFDKDLIEYVPSSPMILSDI